MAETGSVDYEAVLADLRAKRDRIEAAIQGIETMLGIQALSTDAVRKPDRQADTSKQLGPGAFLGMTIADAAKAYLAHKRQNQRTDEILKALQEGGLVLTGESPLNVVGSVLNRNYNNGGEIVKVSRGVWGLASWHPRLKKRGKNGTAANDTGAPNGDSEMEDYDVLLAGKPSTPPSEPEEEAL